MQATQHTYRPGDRVVWACWQAYSLRYLPAVVLKATAKRLRIRVSDGSREVCVPLSGVRPESVWGGFVCPAE